MVSRPVAFALKLLTTGTCVLGSLTQGFPGLRLAVGAHVIFGVFANTLGTTSAEHGLGGGEGSPGFAQGSLWNRGPLRTKVVQSFRRAQTVPKALVKV